MHTFNNEDLVQYMYKESSAEKTAAIAAALETDWSLREKYELLLDGQKNLEALNFSPRKKTVKAILSQANISVGELTNEV
ncbi:hypothetical protein LK994_06225 [Ferruginibacter lapsinanis]|uniref:hypothetical protein n=1 Tax=Ferruginibacter lapsinanis TaxID=563172 RepID=UPI001E2AEC93|nr:hypothetical protein [Ferruginibacter lapsinanis]UEG51070.1 hypothetical protein LK994_06225 [Ferruginibacter lapsinanis]